MKQAIVYAIANLVTGRCYIGSTSYRADRWATHRGQLRRGEHKNRHLQASWIKHGEDRFEFKVLEIVEDPEARIEREQFWLDTTPLKFNIRIQAVDNTGFRHSEETKAAMRGRKHTDDTKRKCAQVWLGKTLTKEHRAAIAEGKTGKPMSEKARANMSASSNRTCIMTSEQRAQAANARAKEYVVTSPDGTELMIRNMRKFCRENGLQQGLMAAVLRGRQTNHRGWTARHHS